MLLSSIQGRIRFPSVNFNQCQQKGGKVRKDEKSQMVVFWKWI